MNIDVEGSLCLPRKCPPRLEIEPTGVTVTATGTPHVVATPVKVKLPHVKGTLPKMRLTLPKPEAEAALYMIPWIEAPLASFDFKEVMDLITGGGTLADLIKEATRRVPAAKESADANAVTGEPRANGESDALRYNSAGVGLCFEMRADLGEMTLDMGTFEIDMDSVQVHGMPEDPKAGIVAPRVTLDLDALTLRAATDRVDARLTGCIVLNGGDCCEDEAPAKPAAPRGAKAPPRRRSGRRT